MLIRSQNKQVLVNMDNVTSISIEGDNQLLAQGGISTILLGKYSNIERAEEVLDAIENMREELECVRIMGAQGNKIPCIVFQMPQDNEVET